MLYIVLFLVVVIAIVIWIVSRAMAKEGKPHADRRKKLEEAEKHFEPAKATVLWANYYQDYPDPAHAKYGIHLKVEKADGTSYKHTDGNPSRKQDFWVIRKGDMVHLKKGAVLPVRIHAKDPKWLFFEFEFE